MQDQTAKQVIRKRPLAAHASTLPLLQHLPARSVELLERGRFLCFGRGGGGRWRPLRGLQAQGRREDELADSGGEAGEEGVEGL